VIRADERLQRLLMAFPLMADEPGLSLRDIAERIGTTTKELTKDFASLERYDVPAGWVDTVQVLKALTVRRAASVSDGAKREDTVQAESAREPELAVLGTLQTAFEQRVVVVMHYQRPDEAQAGTRRVRPYALVRADAHVYLVGHCERAEALRVFRLDRVTGAQITADGYALPGDFSVAQMLQGGGVFKRDEGKDDTLVVRYSPQVARWIAERTQQTPGPDGTITVSYPLADEAWAVRHVMQYGPDAVVVSPAAIRDKVIAAIDTLLGDG